MSSKAQPVHQAYIELRPNREGRLRAYLVGTRVRVQDIYADSELRGKSPDQIVASLPHLTLAQVHAALSYYFDHREAILEEIRQDGMSVAEIKSKSGPGPLELKLKDTDVHGDSVSS